MRQNDWQAKRAVEVSKMARDFRPQLLYMSNMIQRYLPSRSVYVKPFLFHSGLLDIRLSR